MVVRNISFKSEPRQSKGFEFHLVVVAPPRRPTIDVQNLAAILGDRDPEEVFGVPGGHMKVEVSDVEISEVSGLR
jgi:hypothetical protein